ncbi:hypothetical protein HU200_055539 [Digitaria exilis]|uniref:Uncharacterized protein n=1 Tax=Digitaria exilis TaxID=1010633 RepID=A0A835ADL4_9POAL|nr:hypothetical protein HU200_055539 [Digitaria exilis]
MSTTTTSPTLKMKLLIDTKANCVLYAEADKDVVDFLFSLLSLPVATIVKMLGKGSMPGSFGNLYGSVEKLDHTYVLPHVEKRDILRPTVMQSAACTSRSSLLFMPAHSSTGAGGKGFVKGVVTYTIKDDLTVTPMSTISSITMLNAAAVRNFGDLREKIVRLGYTESKTVLTDVFLAKKRRLRASGAGNKYQTRVPSRMLRPDVRALATLVVSW